MSNNITPDASPKGLNLVAQAIAEPSVTQVTISDGRYPNISEAIGTCHGYNLNPAEVGNHYYVLNGNFLYIEDPVAGGHIVFINEEAVGDCFPIYFREWSMHAQDYCPFFMEVSPSMIPRDARQIEPSGVRRLCERELERNINYLNTELEAVKKAKRSRKKCLTVLTNDQSIHRTSLLQDRQESIIRKMEYLKG